MPQISDDIWRVIGGFIAAPIVAVILLWPVCGVLDIVMLGKRFMEMPLMMSIGMMVGAVHIFITIAGVPLVLMFKKLHWGKTWWHACLVGACFGLLTTRLVDQTVWKHEVTFVIFGTMIAYFLWLFSLRNNPWFRERGLIMAVQSLEELCQMQSPHITKSLKF